MSGKRLGQAANCQRHGKLLFDLEDKFEIEVPEDRAGLTTLGEAAALVDELIRAKTA